MGNSGRAVDPTVAALVEEYEVGASMRDLASLFAMSVEEVRGGLLEAGVTIRRTGRLKALPDTPEINAELLVGWRTGETLGSLGGRHGVPAAAVRRRLLALGVAERELPARQLPTRKKSNRRNRRVRKGDRPLPPRDYEGPRIPQTPEVLEALAEAWVAGTSTRDLAEELGASRKEVREALRAAGVDPAARADSARR